MLALYSIVLFAQVRGLQMTSSVSPRTVYVGQQVSYDASMIANVLMQKSFQAPPEYTPPDVRGVTLYDFPFDTIKSVREVQVSGLPLKQFTYHRAIFPLAAGVDTIPPATLVYTLPNGDDPYEPKIDSIRTTPQIFTVLPLPTAGRPADFTGMVGKFTIAMHPDSQATFRGGTAFVLHVAVTGTGNIDLIQRPVLTIPWATVVPTTEQVSWDSTGVLVRGSKDFLWLVTPHGGGSRVIPAVQYSYFDPDAKRYETVQAPPITVTVVGGLLGAMTNPGDTIGNTPFPIMVRTIRRHLVLSTVLALLVLAGIITLIVRAVRHNDLDDIHDEDDEEFEEDLDEDLA